MNDPIQLLITGGGAAVAIWVLKQFIDGKIHSQSEVDVHLKRVNDLLTQNEALTSALNAANTQAATIIDLLKRLQSSDEER